MGLATVLLTCATLVVAVVQVRATVCRPPAPGAPGPGLLAVVGATPTRLVLLGATLVIFLLCAPFAIQRPAAHDKAACGNAISPGRTVRDGLPVEPAPECTRARAVRLAAAAGTTGLTVVSAVVLDRRRRRAAARD